MIASLSDDALSRRALFRLQFGALTDRIAPKPDVEAIKKEIASRWEGPSEALMRAWEPLAPIICEAADVGPGMRVLDAAAGDGNVALEAARRGADVFAYDIAFEQIARGRDRSDAADLDVTWMNADLEELPDFDGVYDIVLSLYGATLAPRPRRTVRELLRILRPGGLLVMAAPAPHSLTDRAFDLAQEGRGRLPDSLPAPGEWGRDDVAIERIMSVAPDTKVVTRLVAYTLEFASEAEAWDAYAGPFGLPAPARDRFADEISARSDTMDSVRVTEWVTLIVARRAGGSAKPDDGTDSDSLS
jgi:SAM-dependent methyltransferase